MRTFKSEMRRWVTLTGPTSDWIAWLHGHMNRNLGRLASVPFNRQIAMNFFVKAFFAFRKAFPVISKYLKAR